MTIISTSEGDIELTGEAEAAFLASLPGDIELPYIIPKTLPWRRMTDAEAEIMETAMDSASAKLRQIYAAATELNSGDEFWPVLQGLLASQFGENRASELLAPESTA